METSSSEITVQEAFPTITFPVFDSRLGELSPTIPLTSFVKTSNFGELCHILASLLMADSTAPFRSSLPGLGLVETETIISCVLPIRVINALHRLNLRFWQDLLEMSPSDLLKIKNLGQLSMLCLLTHAARTSAESLARNPWRPPPTSQSPAIASDAAQLRPDFITERLGNLARWSVYENEAKTLGELICALPRLPLPPDLAESWSSLSETSLDVFSDDSHTDNTIGHLIEELLSLVPERERYVFSSRISQTTTRTLGELGEELGLTRERVRQLQVRAEERIQEALGENRFVPIRWRAHTLSRLLGTAVPPSGEPLESAISTVTRDIPDSILVFAKDLLLWLAGPYERDSGTG